jgi:protein-disulfide isomerase
MLHEAAIAVHRLDPNAFLPFTKKLFDIHADYYDEPTKDLTRKQVYTKLAAVAEEWVSEEKFLELLAIKPGNEGNDVTTDLKVHMRIARQNAIHVSPTILFNGLIDGQISSSWGLAEWADYMKALV